MSGAPPVERLPEEKYENLGGVYFPILQLDGRRVLVKVGSGRSHGDLLFLRWLRQHDRQPGLQEESPPTTTPTGKESAHATFL